MCGDIMRTAVVAALSIAAVAALSVAGIRVTSERAREDQGRLDCRARMARIARVVAADLIADPGRRLRAGPGLLFEMRRAGRIGGPGEERTMICPSDDGAIGPRDPSADARYAAASPDEPPADLCSFAVRDFAAFPLDPAAKSPEAVAACLHHPEKLTLRGGANVAWSDGRVTWLGFEELGISEGAELVAGPSSKSPLLRTMLDARGR